MVDCFFLAIKLIDINFLQGLEHLKLLEKLNLYPLPN